MEHLTNFELLLVGASIATFCFGFNTFIKEIFSRVPNLQSNERTSNRRDLDRPHRWPSGDDSQ